MARILAIDDAEDNLLLIDLYLRGANFEVVTATSGEEGLRKGREADFDLILLDVMMPGMDGFQCCTRLKEQERTARVPVIFLTGKFVDLSYKIHGFETGAEDYLTKPIDREELIARVRVMLRLRLVQDELQRSNERLQETVRDRTSALASALEELQRQRSLAEEIFTSLPNLLIVLGEDGRIVGRNIAFDRSFDGVTPGTRLEDYKSLAPLASFLDHDVEVESTAVLQTPHFGPRTFSITRSTMDATPEQGHRVLLSLVDVTDRMLLHSKLKDREKRDLLREIEHLRGQLRGRYSMTNVVGVSEPMRQVASVVDRVRNGRSTVLIQGQSGTGKELVARAIHFDGPFSHRPFIPIHCGAMSPQLIESELFGHERGSFTGAFARKEGLFRAADAGTVFLDEIAETSQDLQVKLLRVLQFGEVRPVGALKSEKVDVRVIAATNRNLRQMVNEGKFREDLFYRLEVVTVDLPLLRDRTEDIPVLAEHFLRKFNALYGRLENPVTGISRGAMHLLEQYSWPGNVRELENLFARAFALGVSETIHEEDLPSAVRGGATEPGRAERPSEPLPKEETFQDAVEDKERQVIIAAIRDAAGDKIEAAKRLGIGKSTIYRKIRSLGIEV